MLAFDMMPIAVAVAVVAGCVATPPPRVVSPPLAASKPAECAVDGKGEVLLIDWPNDARAEMEALVSQGVIAVRYSADCHVQLLRQCTATGKYEYAPFTAKHDRVVVTDSEELRATMPAGADALQPKLTAGKKLTADMSIVGRYASRKHAFHPHELKGDCSGATHVVVGISVGAFQLAAGDTSSRVESLGGEGTHEACLGSTHKDTSPPGACRSLLRMHLSPLDRRPLPLSADGMVRVPAGTFAMGDKSRGEVSLPSFEIDVTEVTVHAFQNCVATGKCKAAGTKAGCNWGEPSRADHPINCVDWAQAAAYCAWVGKRLPTEPEWEYAARGADDRRFPWGNAEPTTQLCWKQNSTCPVGRTPSGDSPFGLHDMAGNVWEWTSSTRCPPKVAISTCEAMYRVGRGGGWNGYDPQFVSAMVNETSVSSLSSPTLGFRCAR